MSAETDRELAGEQHDHALKRDTLINWALVIGFVLILAVAGAIEGAPS